MLSLRAMNLQIVYQDEHYIAINKPSGLLVHRSPIDRHETRFAIQVLREQIGQTVYPVHRLDKPTSGILLFALTKPALTAASQLFMQKSTQAQQLEDDGYQSANEAAQQTVIEKTYIAIVRGYTPPNQSIEHPVKAQIDKRFPDQRNAQMGKTHLQTLAHTELPSNIDKYPTSRYSLVKLQPITGRRHQLRYHMKHIAHPIIGDAKYGKGKHNRFFQQQFNNQRLLLAATELRLTHPISLKPLTLCCSAGDDFINVATQLGWQEQLSKACNHNAH